jgi:hypothetical protein
MAVQAMFICIIGPFCFTNVQKVCLGAVGCVTRRRLKYVVNETVFIQLKELIIQFSVVSLDLSLWFASRQHDLLIVAEPHACRQSCCRSRRPSSGGRDSCL